jgi:hypothetical protein
MLLPPLDEQPDLLAPRAALVRRRNAARRDGSPLVVSDAWRIAASEAGWTVHVCDRTRATTWRFALTPTSLDLLRRLVPGAEPPPLDAHTETTLIDAGILVAEGAASGALLPAARASFAAEGFAVVPDVLHPYEVAAVRRYVRAHIRTGAFPLGDPKVTRRHHAHNEPLLRDLQERLLGLVTAVVGVPIKPSYVYLSAYTAGSILPPHRDRPQCEYSLTLQVDYTPEPALEAGWPLRLALPNAELTVFQSLGDGLVFAGREHEHFRDRLPAGHTSTTVLAHFVDATFEGSLQ